MATKTQVKNDKVGIVGSGLIGRSWSMLFAAAGYKVVMFDIQPAQVQSALSEILVQLKNLQEKGLLRGSLTVEEQHARISGTNDLRQCVQDAVYIQECVPEVLELKKKVWSEIDEYITSDQTIMASSTSSMPASTFTNELKHKAQCIVCHPTNPPFYCPLTEVVPAPYTLPAITDRTMLVMKEIGQVAVKLKKELFGFALNRMQYALLNECWRLISINPPLFVPLVELVPSPWTLPHITADARTIISGLGQSPVLLKKELPGFAVNRVQYALLMECWRLIKDDAISLEDLDKVMKDGLGMRYAFMGPMETIHLNAEGVASYCDRYGEMIYNISSQMGPIPKLDSSSEAAKRMERELVSKIPLDQLDERRKWRDTRLAGLAKLKKEMND